MVYSEVEKIEVLALLAEYKGDLVQTSRQTGIPIRTLTRWRDAPVENLETRLERVANELVASMPEKLNDADLSQLTRALAVVLSNLKRADPGEEEDEGVDVEAYEKIARLINQYTAKRRTNGDPERPDGQGN